MNTKFLGLLKVFTISVIALLLNVIIISNYDFSSAAELTNEDLLPEINNYWEYRRQDFTDGSIYEYNLTLTKFVTKTIANKETKVMILEGYGEIVKWPKDTVPSEKNEIYIRKEINTDTMEITKYTQYITLEYFIDGNYSTSFIHENTTYDYEDLTKPKSITVGSNWVKNITVRPTLEKKIENGTIENFTLDRYKMNSSVVCDSIKNPNVPAGRYNTFLIIENQKIIIKKGEGEKDEETTAKKVWYYYSKDIKGYVKKERYDEFDNLEEEEVLLKFDTGVKPNDKPKNNDSKDNDDKPLIDLGDRNVQLIIGGICIFIACVIFGYSGYKRKKD